MNKEKIVFRPKDGYYHHQKPPLKMEALRIFGMFCRLMFWVGLIILLIFAGIAHIKGEPPIMETAEAKTILTFIDPEAHETIEYYVDGKRYIREVLKKTIDEVSTTAISYGMNPNHLLALCLQEGVEFTDGHAYACSPTAVGDNGRAIGAFQILANYQRMNKEDAKNIVASAKWTAERMLRYGYKENPKYAMQCHNSIYNKRYGNTVWQIARTLKPINTL